MSSIALAASVMRRLPTRVRRVRMLRDSLYERLGAAGWEENEAIDRQWPSALQFARGRLSRMNMALDLTDWCQRRTYFTGRFYQEDLEDLLTALLRPGDNFVDVGANIGLVTLHAASIVGDNFWSFEPNPQVYARLVQHVDMNGLARRRVFNCGLGSEPGRLTMSLYGRHTGKATLVEQDAPVLESLAVEVKRGDAVLKRSAKPTVIKIDVEGFEVPVIDGLGRVLDGNVAVIVEVSRSWLEKAGNSVEELHALLGAHGLEPHAFELTESRMNRRLSVRRLTGPLSSDQYDCLFMRPASVFAERLALNPH